MNKFVGAALFTLMSLPATAATYNFDYTYDGSNMVLDAGSDDPLNQAINVGDTFYLTLSAQANMAWSVLSSFVSSIDNSFRVDPSGTRTGNLTATQSLDGNVVSTQDIAGLTQSFIHMGGQTLNYTAGNLFDQLTLQYTLTSDSSGGTMITDGNPGYFGSFVNDTRIAYVDAPDVSPVPLPASLPLLLVAMGGMAVLGRRRKAA